MTDNDNPTVYETIEQLISAQDSELFEIIGSYELQSSLELHPRNKKELQTVGQKWLKRHMRDLKKIICNSNVVRAYLRSERIQDQVLMVAAIADLISSLVGGKAALAVAVSIVKEGLTTLCGSKK